MDVGSLAQYISIPLPTAWEASFPAAMEAYRADWLDQLDFTEILDYYQFPKDYYYDRLGKELSLLARDEKLNKICWLMHYILFYGEGSARQAIYAWDSGGQPFQNHGSNVIPVVALLAGQPIHAKNMQQRQYDTQQITFHKAGVRNSWIGQHEDRGLEGISFNLMSWGSHFVRCTLVRLGRLMYEYAPNKHPDYRQLFGDAICPVELHIPASDNGLQDEEVEASFRLAREKLQVYFPEATGKKLGFCLSSWLLSPQLEQILKPDSNIMKFKRRFTVTKTYGGRSSFLSNVFKVGEGADIAALPEDTHLRREVKKRLLQDAPLENGKGYYVPEEGEKLC